jgi:hypothetical protein
LSLEEIARIAPIGTVIVALGALSVATWSLLAQKGVARRRAAIDFFLKTEMDEKLLVAYDNYKDGVDALRKAVDLDDFCKSNHYHHVRSYLNVLELMAVGIENNTFDERICYVYWKGFVLDVMADTAKLIDHIRQKHNADLYFRSFRRLHYRWMSNPELARRWQHNGSSLRRGPIPLRPPA